MPPRVPVVGSSGTSNWSPPACLPPFPVPSVKQSTLIWLVKDFLRLSIFPASRSNLPAEPSVMSFSNSLITMSPPTCFQGYS